MKSNKKIAVIVGWLFIISTITGVISVIMLGAILDVPDYLTKVATNENQLIIGALLELACAGAFIGVAIMIYPVLKTYNKNIAIGYIVGRSFEAVPFVIGIISLLSLFTLSQEYIQAGVQGATLFQPFGTLLLSVRDWSNVLGARLFCGLAALPFYYLLFRTKLLPRFISVWGFLGTILYLIVVLLIMYGLSPVSMLSVSLTLPFALNEMVLAVWLIVKGFNVSPIDYMSV
jgi:hypothetical protein